MSHWAVNCEATVDLITKAFYELAGNAKMGRGEALRHSTLALISKGNAHPANWAPLHCGRRRRRSLDVAHVRIWHVAAVPVVRVFVRSWR